MLTHGSLFGGARVRHAATHHRTRGVRSAHPTLALYADPASQNLLQFPERGGVVAPGKQIVWRERNNAIPWGDVTTRLVKSGVDEPMQRG